MQSQQVLEKNKSQQKKQKLAKLIASRSALSRRSAEDAILDGNVLVDGRKPKVSERFDSNVEIVLNGKVLKPLNQKIYILFNKPRGYAVTKKDRHLKKTIWDLLPEFKDKLNSAGRLDVDSEGLLFLTNDGSLIEKITHPRYKFTKTYRVEVLGDVTEEIVRKFEKGVKLRDGISRAKRAKIISKNTLELVLSEGKKREIRRMCQSQRLKVLLLRRIALGKIKIGTLKVGKWRYVKLPELQEIMSEFQ